MEISSEIRWFGLTARQAASLGSALALSPAQERVDRYLMFPTPALGVKWREGRLEIKHRLGVRTDYTWMGSIEHWVKWSAPNLPQDISGNGEWVEVAKRRRLAVFADQGGAVSRVSADDEPADGCNVELTEVKSGKESTWTLGLEAYGREGRDMRLFQTLIACTEAIKPRGLRLAQSCGYPEWLQRNRAM